MSDAASGANVMRIFNPDDDIYYCMTEEADVEIRDLFAAIRAIAMLTDSFATRGPDIEPEHLSPILRTLACHGERIMDSCPLRS